MTQIQDILISLGTMKSWEEKPDGLWLEDPELDLRKTAGLLAEEGARLVTVSASRLDSGEFRLIYHWDLEGRLLNYVTITRQGALPGIADICPAADWIEREIHDYYNMDFTGRELTPLMLEDDAAAGFFSRKFQRKRKGGALQ